MCIAVVAMNMFFIHSWLLGLLALLVYGVVLSIRVSQSLGTIFEQLERQFWGRVVVFVAFMLMTTILYYTHGITPALSLFLMLFPLLIFALPKKVEDAYLTKVCEKKSIDVLTLLVIVGDFFLFVLVYHARTVNVLVSPWHALPASFFLLYALVTGLLFYRNHKSNNTFLRFTVTSIHLFLTFSVASIIYVNGFGFDGFIHRATEEWIVQHGFILPKTLYYIGQYSFIAWLSHITQAPVFWLDTFFVPLTAAFMLPPVIAYSLKQAKHIPERMGTHMVWLVPLLYFLTLNLTTPHNVVIELFIATIFTLFAYSKSEFPGWIPLLLATAALATHPLLGAPLTVFAVCAVAQKHVRTKRASYGILIIFFLTTIALPTVLFAANNFLAGTGLPVLKNPFTRIDLFWELLRRPYWYAAHAPLQYEILYAWQLMIAPVIFFAAIFGLRKWKTSGEEYIFPLGFVSFLLASFLLSALIYFPNVTQAEQTNYPLRLLWISIVFLLPFAAKGVYDVYSLLEKRIHKKSQQKILEFGFISLISIALMLSLYFAYPQRNIKARFPGYNVTDADVHTVEYIASLHSDQQYVVIANQLVGAAALTKFSFSTYFDTALGSLYFYSIPGGGPLGDIHGKMLYQGQKREFMEEAMDLTGVDTAYFAVPNYWANFDDIVSGAAKTADAVHAVDGGKVMVFTYYR